jgi:hypothetical protein
MFRLLRSTLVQTAGERETLQRDNGEEGSNCLDPSETLLLRRIEIKDAKFVFDTQPGGSTADFSYVDANSGTGESWYYVRVTQTDRNLAWSAVAGQDHRFGASCIRSTVAASTAFRVYGKG